MKKITIYIITILTLFTIFISNVNAEEEEKNIVNLYLFYSDTCPHCSKEISLLDKLSKEYSNLRIYSYEIKEEKDKELYQQATKIFNLNITSIPFTVVGDAYFTGYSKTQSERKLRSVIEYYSTHGYEDKLGKIIGVELSTYEVTSNVDIFKYLEDKDNKIIDVPIIGKVNTKNLALPIVTIIIALIDGFNPCAMWVLLFLLSMLIGMKDKKRMWTLGLCFIITSATIYYLFMASWLNITQTFTKISLLRNIIALVAIIGGLYNLYSYIKTRKDTGCSVINDKKRTKIFTKIKKFTTEKNFILALLGTITLAITVNLVELACSAGLPVMYIEILQINGLTQFEYYIYLFLYVLIFMLDDIIVFTVAMITLQLTGISTKYGKLTKLIGGIILLLIGLLMIFNPSWLMFNF